MEDKWEDKEEVGMVTRRVMPRRAVKADRQAAATSNTIATKQEKQAVKADKDKNSTGAKFGEVTYGRRKDIF